METTSLKDNLARFTGSEQWFKYPMSGATYTEGVRYFLENAQAYWLLDIIATQPEIVAQMKNGGAYTTLDVADDDTAVITVTDGNHGMVYQRRLEFTDCPHGVWELWFIDNVVLLPSEY